jgi:sugar O-acyltransferase (sialic acid O-acetyltransferase NeuD family)
MQDLVILGAGGLAREVAWLVEEINHAEPTWNFLGYVDKDAERVGAVVGRHAIVCSEAELAHRKLAVAIGIGTPAILREVSTRFAGYANLSFPNLIHPTVLVDAATLQLGRGNLIAARNILTVNVRLGSFNVVNLNCTIGHGVVIGDCCVINPGAHLSGGDTIGSQCLIGAGATVLGGLTIGDGVLVGAGSVVVKSVKGPATVMGVPARALSVPG